MNVSDYIQQIRSHLVQTHTDVAAWFEEDDDIRAYRPKDQGWTINEILEHIALTSHFLLILIGKGVKKALRNSQNSDLGLAMDQFENRLDQMAEIGRHKAFSWIRPDHMEPKGEKSQAEVKEELTGQLERYLNYLDQLKNGEGLLYKMTMSVNDLGKINVYEYIYFLSLHAERHIRQMEENKREFLGVNTP
ncbi:MAG TPA: DinB family protein [Flavilitoribacter sp.]|nr:DinB family protein [Flavilitoribacter sp.]HMQ88611.1 DinB family protein [Flavilitoribacter sp.]